MTQSSAVKAVPAVAPLYPPREERLIERALAVMERRMFQRGPTLHDPADTRRYLRLKLGKEMREIFALVFLDARLRVIAFEPLFQGTLDSATVFPREIVRRALAHNAAAVIFAHNHPSGSTEPSAHDRSLTLRLREALALIEVRVLDHVIVGQGEPFSFSDACLL